MFVREPKDKYLKSALQSLITGKYFIRGLYISSVFVYSVLSQQSCYELLNYFKKIISSFLLSVFRANSRFLVLVDKISTVEVLCNYLYYIF